jgi:ABC-type branched-subunit amino acid transport system substrate-binding protein
MGIDDVNRLPMLLVDNNLTHVTEDSKRDSQSVIFGAFDVANAGAVAVVGAASSTPSMSANHVLSRLGVPQISYSSTAPILSDKSQFPTFMRTVPSDSVQGEVMITLARNLFGWSKIGLLSTTDGYGSGGAASIVTQAAVRDIQCQGKSRHLSTEARYNARCTCASHILLW